eukprot:33666-Rhodomonas_salina.1
MSASTRWGPGSWRGRGSTRALSTRATREASRVKDSPVANVSLLPWNTCVPRPLTSQRPHTARVEAQEPAAASTPVGACARRPARVQEKNSNNKKKRKKTGKARTRMMRLGCCWKGAKRRPSKEAVPCSPACSARRRSTSSLTTNNSTTSPADSSRSCRQWHRRGRS